MVSQETEAGISEVKHYSLPVEQPLSAAVSPAAEVRRDSTTAFREFKFWVQNCFGRINPCAAYRVPTFLFQLILAFCLLVSFILSYLMLDSDF